MSLSELPRLPCPVPGCGGHNMQSDVLEHIAEAEQDAAEPNLFD